MLNDDGNIDCCCTDMMYESARAPAVDSLCGLPPNEFHWRTNCKAAELRSQG
jgi:hypothetical protein